MPDLSTARGSDFVPDGSKAFGLLQEGIKTFQTRGLTETLAGTPTPDQEKQALVQLSTINPEVARTVQGVLQRNDVKEQQAVAKEIRQGLELATRLKGMDHNGQRRLLMSDAKNKIANGGDPRRIMDLMGKTKDELKLEIDRMIVAGTAGETLLKRPQQQAALKAQKDARFASDVKSALQAGDESKLSEMFFIAQQNGDTDQVNFIDSLRGLTQGQQVARIEDVQRRVPAVKPISVAKGARLFDPGTKQFIFDSPIEADGGVDFAKPAVKDFTPESVKKAGLPSGSESDLVLRPEVLASLGGSDAFKIGREVKIRVGDKEFFVTPVTQRNKKGEVVTVGNLTPIVGPDEGKTVDFISPLGETGLEQTGRKVGEGTELAQRKQSLVISKEAFDQILPIDKSLQAIDEGIAALNAGANTGPIISKLPSITQASVTLDNVQARMGLNVIQSTTFGSLSESELKFALSAALPQSLQEDALKDWLIRKRSVQSKLKNYLVGAASFFGQGGTIKEFNDQQKQLQKLRKAQQPQGTAPQPIGGSALSPADKSELEQLRREQR